LAIAADASAIPSMTPTTRVLTPRTPTRNMGSRL
jgi:hypothetical protein